ncbi:trimeric intracellular cation channel family protein [Tenacibaculum finnmarkense genomovar finnmarkense]|uniref:Trimeric intracellular cation channel family protein n=1 Tax=Tenacibaculum finnmarkense genomovar finnmarkense TaxID=1458503 RepID=A0AAP1REK9_9FLAO|nr:trimeric intracellular cation channel family protein [Tenacibaculum finnmarkense]MBE7645766.1 trimeric intracellular cation channel family protein [Tenacibaculum finnmarkense genomovar ulcerans]MBE7652581.1 trimeric intracellular cation channel family protein [Tenacibaculum finnmarkense genomovar finnmarkense]MBE7661328.1 trimeric intracellular cation channel family protein [Tenacibaculum finnmarkense genomovar finnmarkense]MBE7688111.1 trimeric intracellular cation channel family protein [T
MDIIYALDIAGTFAFAISGALVAMKKQFDVFGVVIIAFVTAVGGGMIRDVLINAHPINWISDLNYIWTILTAVGFTFLFRSKIAPLRKTMFLFDTIGISVFTLLGLEKGLSYDLHPFVALVMGMVSAVFGGVLRDVLTRKVPLIFKKEIYASACLAGGVVYLILEEFKINKDLQFVIPTLVVFLIRSIVVKYKLELPKIKADALGELG